MNENNYKSTTPRRTFITAIVSSCAALGLSSFIAPNKLGQENRPEIKKQNDAEKWFEKVKGKHKMVIDVPKHNEGRAIGWANTMLNTYNEMGIPDDQLSIILIFRSGGTPITISDNMWLKYGFGERIELKDPTTKTFATKNLFAKCNNDGDGCIELLQKRGTMICVCNHSIERIGEGYAKKLNLDKEIVLKEIKENLLPGIQIVPSGMWALNHAQELGCKYSYGG